MLALDTEFFNTKEEFVTPVCACFYDLQTKITRRFWTLDPASKAKCIEYLNEHKDIPILSWNAVAEGRFLYSLGLDPMDFKWVDLFLEFRCLTNHNDRLNWGKQLVKGKVVMTYKPRPKWQRREGEKLKSFTPTHSLAEATYKLLGIIRDTDHKNNMRDLLISGDLEQIEANRNAISDYCAEDTIHLEDLYQAILSEYRVQGIAVNAQLSIEMLLRGEYSAVTALMESWGYPVNVEAMRNFADSVMPLLEDCQREINRLFPDIKPFKYCRKEKKFKWDQNKTKQWVLANHDYDRWEKTDSFDEAQKHGLITSENKFKFLSLGLEAWQRFYDFKHDYPLDNFGAQMVRYLKLKQSLAGFVKSSDKGKATIWDSLGSDGRIRPYMNIYGSQSSRSQPSSTSFLFLKPAWMRSLCQPGPGKAIGAYDYGSEEYLISALWAEDANMIEAYRSGDVYLAYAKMIGLVPPDGTKEKYKKERDAQKPIQLGMSYLMTKVGLAVQLSSKGGKVWTEDEAQEEIDKFQNTFYSLTQKQKDIQEEYAETGHLKLKCGWYMFGDNENFRSVVNLASQGAGASIMRRAATQAIRRGLKVILTLHDALYIEYDRGDLAKMDILYECMKEAFIWYFDDKKNAALIRLDGKTWGPDYTEEDLTTPAGIELEASPIFIDDRAYNDYKKFSQYFNEPDYRLFDEV